jgi:hypothetical protein
MKTINLKNAFKLFVLSLLLCSTEAFSFTQIPSDKSSSGNESRTCFVRKATKMSKTTSKVYPLASGDLAMKSKGKKFFKK